MAERLEERPPAVGEGSRESSADGAAAPGTAVESLGRMLKAIQLLPPGAERQQVTGNLIRAIETAEPAAAPFLEAQLDSGAFDALEDGRGGDLKAAAVERLIALGYPHALRISPEALEHLRARGQGTSGSNAFPWLLGAAAVMPLVEAVLYTGGSSDGLPDLLPVFLLLRVLPTVLLSLLGRAGVPVISVLSRLLYVGWSLLGSAALLVLVGMGTGHPPPGPAMIATGITALVTLVLGLLGGKPKAG